MTAGPLLDLTSIRAAAANLAGIAVRTPMVVSAKLSARLGCSAWLKLETLQPVGSFKIRGAANALSRLTPEQRARTAQSAAPPAIMDERSPMRRETSASQQQSVSRIWCPDTKVRAIEELGATVRRLGNSQDEAQREADRLVAEEGRIDIPPFDHPHVIAGQGTIALEILDDRPEVETILVPLSGGGLISGIAIAAKAIKPSIRIIGISMDRGAAMHASLAAGQPVEVEEVSSLADSLGGGVGLKNKLDLRYLQQAGR